MIQLCIIILLFSNFLSFQGFIRLDMSEYQEKHEVCITQVQLYLELYQIKAANLSLSLSDDQLLFSAQDMSNMLSCWQWHNVEASFKM